MKIKEKIIPLKNAIKMAQQDPTLELEAILRLGIEQGITKSDFKLFTNLPKEGAIFIL